MMMDLSMPCIRAQIEAARKHKRKLDTLYLLKDCARNPRGAKGLRTVEGMAQKSCIFEMEYARMTYLPSVVEFSPFSKVSQNTL